MRQVPIPVVVCDRFPVAKLSAVFSTALWAAGSAKAGNKDRAKIAEREVIRFFIRIKMGGLGVEKLFGVNEIIDQEF